MSNDNRCTNASEQLLRDVKLNENQGCIVFNLGIYFPFVEQDRLDVQLIINGSSACDYKLNHRYPNHNYTTVSRKYGRKLSKVGYPYLVDIDDQKPIDLRIRAYVPGTNIDDFLEFTVQTSLTKEMPICALTFHYDLADDKFSFRSYYRVSDTEAIRGWHSHIWSNTPCNDERFTRTTLKKPTLSENLRIYDDVIKPFPLRLQDLIL